MIIDDFVMLGRTVPEPSKTHGNAVCSAGYSKEMRQFIRTYPLRVEDKIPRWSVVEMPVRRNTRDSRNESWQLVTPGEYSINDKYSVHSEFDYLQSVASGSITELNDKKMSLGIIKPEIVETAFSELKPEEEKQMLMFEETRNIRMIPRVTFNDFGCECGVRKLQLRDWGCFEYLRKFPDNPEGLWDNLKFNDKDYEHLFFVGNHKAHRNVWLIITALSRPINKNLDLFHVPQSNDD